VVSSSNQAQYCPSYKTCMVLCIGTGSVFANFNHLLHCSLYYLLLLIVNALQDSVVLTTSSLRCNKEKPCLTTGLLCMSYEVYCIPIEGPDCLNVNILASMLVSCQQVKEVSTELTEFNQQHGHGSLSVYHCVTYVLLCCSLCLEPPNFAIL
jgi:hypothetical protein